MSAPLSLWPSARPIRMFLAGAALVALPVSSSAQPRPAQPAPAGAEVASLREDVRLLQQQVGELRLMVEELARQNEQLRAQIAGGGGGIDGNRREMAALQKSVDTALADQKKETITLVKQQIDELAKRTNAAIEAVGRGAAPRGQASGAFTEDYPKEGVSYTVQPGDTLSKIAQKHNATVRDITNANRIADPSRLQAGQVLFIPQQAKTN